MRRSAALLLTGLMIPLSACASERKGGQIVLTSAPASHSDSAPAAGAKPNLQGQQGQQGRQMGQVASNNKNAPMAELLKGEQQPALDSGGVAQAAERKIIQNAELTIETDKPNDGQQKIGVIAEKHGGFVVVSESKQNEAESQTVASTVVNVIVRVPAQKFQATLDEIRAVGGRILHQKASGQDVTEEYIDLEARIRTKRALETQFLEIMKQARKISDAMEVQTQLADVRTEIERLEGRRRFLENQSALSTINITLHTPIPVVAAATRGFIYDLKAAFGDGMDIGADIFLGIIRFVIIMIPIILFILLPAAYVIKWARRRIPVKAAAANAASTNE